VRLDVICHFEDEPGKVGLPELFESRLYAHPEVSESSIDWSASRDLYVIEFVLGGIPGRIVYAVAKSVADMENRLDGLGSTVEQAKLHIVDASIDGNSNAGLEIFEDLLTRGVSSDKVWFLTAYAAAVLRALSSRNKVRVISKPPNYLSIVDDLFEHLRLGHK